MEGILKFDLNDKDDREAHRRAIKATDLAIVLWEFSVNFKLIENFMVPCYIGNSVTSRISFQNGSFEQISLFRNRKQFYLQSQFHNVNITHIFEYNKNKREILLTPLSKGFSSPLQAKEYPKPA